MRIMTKMMIRGASRSIRTSILTVTRLRASGLLLVLSLAAGPGPGRPDGIGERLAGAALRQPEIGPA